MAPRPPANPRPALGRTLAGLVLLLLLLPGGLVPVAGAAPLPGAPARVASAAATRPAAPPLASGWTSFWAFMRSVVGNRRTMLQVATIGMCIGLFIMMRK